MSQSGSNSARLSSIDALLSSRAREMLAQGGVRDDMSRYRSRDELATAIKAHGVVPGAAVLDFEEQFGGLEFLSGGVNFKLGISMPEEEEEEEEDEEEDEDGSGVPNPRDSGLLPCGTYMSGMYDLWIDSGGAIYAACSRVWKLSNSAIKFIEKMAMQWSIGAYQFTVRVRPPLSSALAESLALPRIDEASDECETWWGGECLTALQVYSPDDARSDTTFISVKSLDNVVRVLDASRKLGDALGFSISARDAKKEIHLSGSCAPVALPNSALLAKEPGARCFRYDGGQASTGDIWVLGRPGHYQIEQYRVYKGRVRGWLSLRDDECVERVL